MKKPERYFYPAIFTYESGQKISVDFPDLKCATSGTDADDALLSALELLGCVLNGLEENGEEIPSPTPLSKLRTLPNERAVLVNAYMPSVRIASVNRSVNRVEIPDYTQRTLAAMDEARHISLTPDVSGYTSMDALKKALEK